MNFNINYFKNLFVAARGNTRFKQVALLYSVNIIGIPIGIITSIIVTRFLGAKVYGDYRLLASIFTMAGILFSFGLYQAGNRALVLNNDVKKSNELYGAELIITIAIFLTMSLFLLIYGLLDTNLKEKGLTLEFLYLVPFCWIFLLVKYFEVLFQADNRIRLLATIRFWPKVGFLVSAVFIFFFYMNYDGNRHALIWFFYLFTQAIVFIYVILYIRPSFENLKKRILEIWHYNKTFGLQVYIGSIVAVGFAQLTSILISYFGFDNTGVGYFSLATTFSMPLSFIPNVIATTHYKDFSTLRSIPKKLIGITILLSIGSLIFLWIVVGPFVLFFYGREFEPVIYLTFIVSTGTALYGISDFFNRFLGAHGQGKSLRNSSILVGVGSLTLNLLLIPNFGEKGAAISVTLTGLIYAINMYIYYHILTKKLLNNSL